ncbi:hypothetical protein [Prochlorococcus marinus]|uniref:hypothetical protein n=1 Tax=Prochlorococcus marinus TaxID=1219 RepID=UPI001C56CAFB|nr:hypothetical protein [Prochlorococcus marinus]MBW3042341.1 hypothetical protein [Prochlorococcus marinus str. XMU1408]
MTKSQFNIKISTELLIQVKRQAMMMGKSLTEHITDLVTESLSENDIQNTNLYSAGKIKNLEKRLLTIESIVSNNEYLNKKLKPFTNPEAINCTRFMRGLFNKEVEKRNLNDKNEAFDDLFKLIKEYNQFDDIFTDRLKEILISENPSPWTGKELNDLVGDDKCNCSIRKGLIQWTGKTDCPSQQEICDKGAELLNLF